MERVFIIAEAGVNHNGDLNIAKKLIDAAADAGADAVKFQTFKADALVTNKAEKAQYQLETTEKSETQRQMLKKLELTAEMHEELIAHCREKNILFMSTPFDMSSIQLLKKFNMSIYKIPSGEITNLPYLREMASLGKKIILSTGMSTLEEIKEAVDILKKYGAADVCVLHCNTSYPTPFEDVNLKAMVTLMDILDLEVGYSDHTIGIEVPIAAVAMGATIIEKHFTLDKGMSGPDHKASLEPDELKQMVRCIRNIEKALGDGKKQVSASESGNMSVVRKSIVAAEKIHKGEIFTERNLTTKRPGMGISPMRWDEVIGKVADREYEMDEMIQL